MRVDRAGIGFLGHEPLVYKELTALENLDLYGRLYAIEERRERIGMLLERFGLWDARGELVSTFSRGMAQRLALCRSLLHDPELLILDEATANIDTVTEQLLEQILGQLPSSTTKVIIAHRLNTIADADEIFFINAGTITPAGSMEHALEMLLHHKRES